MKENELSKGEFALLEKLIKELPYEPFDLSVVERVVYNNPIMKDRLLTFMRINRLISGVYANPQLTEKGEVFKGLETWGKYQKWRSENDETERTIKWVQKRWWIPIIAIALFTMIWDTAKELWLFKPTIPTEVLPNKPTVVIQLPQKTQIQLTEYLADSLKVHQDSITISVK